MNLTGFLWAASLTSSILSPSNSAAEVLPSPPEAMQSENEQSVDVPTISHPPFLAPFIFVHTFCRPTAAKAVELCLNRATQGVPFWPLTRSLLTPNRAEGSPQPESPSESTDWQLAEAGPTPGAISAGFISSGLVSSSLFATHLGEEDAAPSPLNLVGSTASRLPLGAEGGTLVDMEYHTRSTGSFPSSPHIHGQTDVKRVSWVPPTSPVSDNNQGDSSSSCTSFAQPNSPNQPSRTQEASPDPCDSPQFQVWLQKTLILTVTERDRAYLIGQNLDQALQTGDLEPAALQLRQAGDALIGQAGSHDLFEVDPGLAEQLGQNQEMLAIKGLNNLRSALGADPEPVTVAQADLHRLDPTDASIEGTASWYGPYFHGRLTATGEVFDQNQLTAAHPSLPFDTFLKVTNLKNGEAVIVRVNDRGPYVGDRSLDLSLAAARHLGAEQTGVIPYRATIMTQQD